MVKISASIQKAMSIICKNYCYLDPAFLKSTTFYIFENLSIVKDGF